MFRKPGLYFLRGATLVGVTIVSLACSGCAGNNTTSDLGTIVTVAGTGQLGDSGDGGPATSAQLYQPVCAVLDSAGNLYIGDAETDTIRKVAAETGIISTFAGNGKHGYSGDGGPATSASMEGPAACALDSAGNLYVADGANNVIRKISVATGVITTVAGNGAGGGFSGDGGPAIKAELNSPDGVVVDSSGNLFISDTSNQRVREVNASTGMISTIAGNGTYGYPGSGGKATSTVMGNPEGLTLDSDGNLYIAEEGACAVAKLSLSTGTIAIVAGTGKSCSPGENNGDGGLAKLASLAEPAGVALDSAGDIFISDTGSSRVREVTPSNGVITSVVGTTFGYSGDGGPSDHAQVHNPLGLFIDASGDLYIADSDNGVVRKVTPRQK